MIVLEFLFFVWFIPTTVVGVPWAVYTRPDGISIGKAVATAYLGVLLIAHTLVDPFVRSYDGKW